MDHPFVKVFQLGRISARPPLPLMELYDVMKPSTKCVIGLIDRSATCTVHQPSSGGFRLRIRRSYSPDLKPIW